jgi:hypothetical protein
MKAWLCGALLLVGGCGIFEPDSDNKEKLENALAGWKRLGITDYTYVYSRVCECPASWLEPARVTVRNGEVVEAVNVNDGAARNIDRMPTIDDLFQMIIEAFDEEAEVIDIRYDTKLYYPLDMLIDDDRQTVDDELIMHSSALTRLR